MSHPPHDLQIDTDTAQAAVPLTRAPPRANVLLDPLLALRSGVSAAALTLALRYHCDLRAGRRLRTHPTAYGVDRRRLTLAPITRCIRETIWCSTSTILPAATAVPTAPQNMNWPTQRSKALTTDCGARLLKSPGSPSEKRARNGGGPSTSKSCDSRHMLSPDFSSTGSSNEVNEINDIKKRGWSNNSRWIRA